MATVKLNKQVSEKVRELNALGTFLTDVRLGAVARKLSELPMEKALEVLQSVVDAAEGGDESAQQDPTMAVIEATKKAQKEDQEQVEIEAEPVPEPEEPPQESQDGKWNQKSGGWNDKKWGEEGEDWNKDNKEDWKDEEDWKDDGEVPDLTEPVRNRVLKLNASGKLCSEIDLDKIGSGLAKLSEPIALQLLKDIFENADMVDKPNHLIGDASRKILLSGRGAASEKVAHQIGNLMRRIRWVNSNVSLAFPLHMGNVLDILQPLHHADAMQLLKKLVQQADDIDSPQSWLRKEAKHIQDNPEEGWAAQKGKGKGNDWKDKDKDWKDNGKQKAGGTIRAAPATAYGDAWARHMATSQGWLAGSPPAKWQKTGNSWDDNKKPWEKKTWKDWGKSEEDEWSKEIKAKKGWK
ncbi:unnamed protein product [Cladocopium goreaui]|uniref:Uncharacterized protein n=1 Tax=Cladocopium goreaui TaxID=2562237 RepID=A0A9P1CPG0_9DINO|nr:unnamed protein product [Cladocopium goreaui]